LPDSSRDTAEQLCEPAAELIELTTAPSPDTLVGESIVLTCFAVVLPGVHSKSFQGPLIPSCER
jgi:hypothetical protein